MILSSLKRICEKLDNTIKMLCFKRKLCSQVFVFSGVAICCFAELRGIENRQRTTDNRDLLENFCNFLKHVQIVHF